MRAVVVCQYGGVLEVMDRPIPRPGAGEVLVRVRASGLCSTDLHLLSGRQPLGELPRILGHELAGEVVELGHGVAGWQLDDRVTAAIDIACGRCRHCRSGQTQRCPTMKRIGFERDGGHAEYVTLPAANLVALPPELSYEGAAILPDAVACMYHSLIHQGGLSVGHRVVMLGVGGDSWGADCAPRRSASAGDQPSAGAAGPCGTVRGDRGESDAPVTGGDGGRIHGRGGSRCGR